jgi:hypothetical protein
MDAEKRGERERRREHAAERTGAEIGASENPAREQERRHRDQELRGRTSETEEERRGVVGGIVEIETEPEGKARRTQNEAEGEDRGHERERSRTAPGESEERCPCREHEEGRGVERERSTTLESRELRGIAGERRDPEKIPRRGAKFEEEPRALLGAGPIRISETLEYRAL